MRGDQAERDEGAEDARVLRAKRHERRVLGTRRRHTGNGRVALLKILVKHGDEDGDDDCRVHQVLADIRARLIPENIARVDTKGGTGRVTGADCSEETKHDL